VTDKPVLRVHHIAAIAWCQRKAQLLLRGELVEEETAAMREGRRVAEELGFAEEVLVRRDFGPFVVEGHIDKVDGDGIIEFKYQRSGYPLRYLLSTAHLQANIYAYLKGVEDYAIIVRRAGRRGMLTFSDRADPIRVLREIALAWALYSGFIEPIKTDRRWKCRVCQARKQGLCEGC